MIRKSIKKGEIEDGQINLMKLSPAQYILKIESDSKTSYIKVSKE